MHICTHLRTCENKKNVRWRTTTTTLTSAPIYSIHFGETLFNGTEHFSLNIDKMQCNRQAISYISSLTTDLHTETGGSSVRHATLYIMRASFQIYVSSLIFRKKTFCLDFFHIFFLLVGKTKTHFTYLACTHTLAHESNDDIDGLWMKKEYKVKWRRRSEFESEAIRQKIARLTASSVSLCSPMTLFLFAVIRTCNSLKIMNNVTKSILLDVLAFSLTETCCHSDLLKQCVRQYAHLFVYNTNRSNWGKRQQSRIRQRHGENVLKTNFVAMTFSLRLSTTQFM